VKDPASAKEKIIVALDVPSADAAEALVSALGSEARWFKVGLELFAAAGPSIVREIQASGASVFLDLKLHDIPNTVRSAVSALSSLGVRMLTIHLSGGVEMCQAALTARQETLLLGVTVLTSHLDSTLIETGIKHTVQDQVLRLAELAGKAGVPGLVASPKELGLLRQRFGARFKIVTPGIRPTWSEPGDQKRFTTPAQAIQAGADYLVVGRPITRASNPREAFAKIVSEVNEILTDEPTNR
jgi:orotidine-5'-phosphate decarboxylase